MINGWAREKSGEGRKVVLHKECCDDKGIERVRIGDECVCVMGRRVGCVGWFGRSERRVEEGRGEVEGIKRKERREERRGDLNTKMNEQLNEWMMMIRRKKKGKKGWGGNPF